VPRWKSATPKCQSHTTAGELPGLLPAFIGAEAILFAMMGDHSLKQCKVG
jgi:hypothetical protein